MSQSMNSANQPLYLQIQAMLKQKIEQGELKPGDQIPTEADLVDQFNVSRVTIKNAMKILVDDGLIYRIAGKGSFVSDGHPLLPSRQNSEHAELGLKIGLLLPLANDEFVIKLLQGIEKECRERNVLLSIRFAMEQPEERSGIQAFLQAGMDGLIIFPVDGEAYSDAILQLKNDGFPFVLVDRYLPGIKTNAVYSDNYRGGYIGTEYLIQKGHKKIGILSGTKSITASSEDRFSGYLDAAKAAGLKLEPSHWLTRLDEVCFSDMDATKQAVKEWMDAQQDLTAIFAFSNGMAVVVASIAAERGLAIPEDLAILSFDCPPLRDLQGYFFSRIEQQELSIGMQAVRLLLDTIAGKTDLQQIVVPVQLVEGRST